jgi:hypothetical protein
MVGARLESNSFWARRIWLAETAWQKLLLPEELEDGGARVESNSFWARRIWLVRTAWQQLLLPEQL